MKIFSFKFFIILLFFVIAFNFISHLGSTISNQTYFIGDKVKMDFSQFSDYNAKITTPSTSFIRRGNQDVFIFRPSEVGSYNVVIESSAGEYKYYFDVFSNEDNNISNTREVNNSFNEEITSINNNSEDLGELGDIEELDDSFIERIPADLEIFSSEKIPKFKFSDGEVYSSQVDSSIIDSLSGLLRAYRPKVVVEDLYGNELDVNADINDSQGYFDISVSEFRSITPGLNKLIFTTYEDGNEYVIEKWFLWGVLAINTDKSVYLNGDNALISFGVLSDSGSVVCDAELILEITDSYGKKEVLSTTDNTITVSETCGYLGIVSNPDYFTKYGNLQSGKYYLNLTAYSDSGVYSITDGFEVRDSVSFDVRRVGPTRVYPYIDQSMRFYITAYENYTGKITELAPNSFDIESNPEIKVSDYDDLTKSLTWNVELFAGESYEFGYEFDTPDISPELYFLGPLSIGDFSENRKWQIANDAEVTVDGSIAINNEQYGTGAAVVFVNDTTGYAFYFDSGPQLSYVKTTNGGTTWGSPVSVTAQTDAYTFAIWYDKWTPNYTGTLINIVFGETGGDAFYYKYLNTTGDTLSTEVDATTDIGRLREGAQNPSIVRASSGNLFLSGADDFTVTGDIWKSTNNGSTWAVTSASIFNNDPNDEFALIPLIGGDIFAIHADSSATDLIARRYNETNDTWMIGTTVDSTFTISTTNEIECSWGATLDNSRGYVYVSGNNNAGAVGADLESYFYNLTGWATKTDVYTNINAAGRGVKLSFDSANNLTYATYTRAPGGTATASNIYKVYSSDNMTTWSSESQVSTTQDDLMHQRPDLINGKRLYTTWINNNLNDFLGETLYYNAPSGPQSLQGNYFSTSTVTSVSVSPLDYNRFVLGWCDDATDKINVAVYYTNGTGLTDVVDSTAGACVANSVGNSVTVSGLNSTAFVIGWYDSVDSDITFKVYSSSLSNLTADIDVDTDSGTSAAVSTSALNSTAFVIGWYDFTSEDSTFRVYTSSGTAISAETDVDATAGPASNSVDVAALNSTAFMFSWFDDTDNDASLQPYSISGSSLAVVYDADGGAGESRTTTVSAFNSTNVVFGWYDAGASANDASFRIHLWNATPVSSVNDVDGDVGGSGYDVRVSSLSQSKFGYNWYDSSTDTGAFAQTFRFNTTAISSEITIQSASLQYTDIGSEEYASGLQLCEDTFVVAVANTTSQNFWKLYYSNGTVWNGICPTYVPVISNVNISQITAFSAYVNWSTDVEANSSIIYGTSLTMVSGSMGYNLPKTVHGFNLTGLSPGSTYYFNVTSCIDGRCNSSGPYSFATGIGDPTPVFGEPVESQIWTIETNVKYIINFTNNGTVQSNYTLNVTNITGASYVYLNQTDFNNVNNGTTVFFEVNLSTSTAGFYSFAVNVTSLLDTTKKDGLIVGTNFYNPYIISNNSITSIANAPLDYNKIVNVWCDDTEDDISFGVYNTTGYLLTKVTDVDDTAGACSANTAGHSVSVTALDKNRFVVVWYDSVDSDTTFQIFYANGTAVNTATDLDNDATASLAVSVTPLNSTAFVAAWHDDTSDDISAAVYSNTGSTITSIFDIDADVGALAQAVEVSGINSTAFGVVYFDDSGGGAGINDVYYVTYSYTGTAISSVVTVDANAGNSRSVSLAVMNESSIAVSWVDANDAAKSFAVYYPDGTVRVAATTIDADSTGGEDIRVTAVTQDDFAVSWYDPTTDTGTYAIAYQNNGTSLYSQTTVQPASQQYNDIASEEFTTQIQLCEDSYAVSFVNTTSQAAWKLFYKNGTVWNGICPTYVPVISNVNVSAIEITSAYVNWSTDVEANSSIQYGTTLSLSTGSIGYNFPKTVHGFNLTGLSGQTTYYFNVTSCIDGRCNSSGPYSFFTSTVDTINPFISLVSPTNFANITNPLDYYFVYNVTDVSNIANCSLYIDGNSVETSSSITKNINQTFYHYLSNGTYLWSVACTDQYNNRNITENRTININAVSWSFGKRFYETYTSNFADNQTAVIWLNNSQDSTQNTVGFNLTALSLVNIVNASTSVMGSNGAIIPGGSIVDFSSSFSVSSANVLLTWKIYISNSSGNTLLCQNGNDGAGGTPTDGTAVGQNITCINSDIRLLPSDRITYIINGYNDHPTQIRSINHAWDSPTSSFVDINVSTEGFLNVDLIYPASDTSISTGQQLNVTCQSSCTVGTCRNTIVYLQRNSTTEGWTNVSSSGNIVLSTGETNPHSLGNITATVVNSNFSIQGNIDSNDNYLRCMAVSSYDSEIGNTNRKINVGQSDVAPVVSLTNPNAGIWYSTNNVTLYYNITDINSNVVNSTLILNGLRNMTNATAINLGLINNFSLINFPNGVYNWTVNATDSTNLEGTDLNARSFYIDTIKPSVNLSAPQNDSTFQVNSVQFNYTAFDNLDSVLVCNLTMDNAVQHLNVNSQNGSLKNLTVDNIGVGEHYWNVTCNDDAGNQNSSVTWKFTIADVAPIVDLITQNMTYSTSGNVTLIYNVTDNNGLIQTRLILNGQGNQTNQTEVLNGRYNNFTLVNLAEGIYLWNVNATDTGGLNATNSSSRTFVVDKYAPNISLNYPLNSTVWNTSTINFNFTAYDSVDASLLCNLTIGERTDNDFIAYSGNVTNRPITGLLDGEHYWNVTCNDDAGNFNYSATRIVNVTEYPTITLVTANNSFFNSSSFNLSYTPRDNTNLSLCELYLDGTYNQTHINPTNNAPANFSMTGVSSGVHYWYVVCNDTYELTNISETRKFTVDTNGLSIDLIYPDDGAQFFTMSLNLSFNATDNIDPFLLCNITVNNVVVNTSLAPSGTIVNRSITFASGGLKYWNVTCIDDASNRFTSLTRNFTIEQAPSVALVSPTNNSFYNVSTIAFVYSVADDNDNIANATLILNGLNNQTNTTYIINENENNITIDLPDGFYNWTINVTDLTNLVGGPGYYFVLTVDTKKPWINLSYPENESIISTNNITFDYTAYDLIDSSLTCNLTINDVVRITNIDSPNGTSVSTSFVRPDGIYNWNVYCRDDASNTNYSETRTFTVEAPPIVTSLSPPNEFYSNSTSVNFVYLPQDYIGIYNCSLWIDGQLNSSSGSINPNENNSFTVDGILEGRHYWNVSCYDVFPDFNYGDSNTTNFTVDVTFPSITLNMPINGSNTLKLVGFNFTATDNMDSNLSCNLYTDNRLNVSYINASNATDTLAQINRFSLGQHYWNVSCVDEAGNRNWSTKFTFNVTLADFMVNFSDIRFNITNPIENDTVLVNATIHNLVNVSVPNVTVSFFQGDPSSGGIQLGPNYTVYDILGLSDTIFSINWSVPLGTNQIYVHIDPVVSRNGTIEEWNETNNVANNSATVDGWQYVYGDINEFSLFKLADRENRSVVIWENANLTNGRIYVADSESAITWSSIYAIGMNKTGAFASNDFADADALMGMSNFGDSIYSLFTSGGTPLNRTNLWIFNRYVLNISLTNSTDNNNFMTGILWDGNDDIGDGQYSQDDKEDIIFMTSTNLDKVGAYGTYDYEIRIPAKLREYFAAESRGAVFYTEAL